MRGIDMIAKEREEQIGKHGFTPEKDARYENGEIMALIDLALTEDDDAEGDNTKDYLVGCGMSEEFLDKIRAKSREERLAVAGALIAAQIDVEKLGKVTK